MKKKIVRKYIWYMHLKVNFLDWFLLFISFEEDSVDSSTLRNPGKEDETYIFYSATIKKINNWLKTHHF